MNVVLILKSAFVSQTVSVNRIPHLQGRYVQLDVQFQWTAIHWPVVRSTVDYIIIYR